MEQAPWGRARVPEEELGSAEAEEEWEAAVQEQVRAATVYARIVKPEYPISRATPAIQSNARSVVLK